MQSFHDSLFTFSYKQQKFNLFREEPEGYGKLIAELSRPLEQTRHDFMLNIVRGLIGKIRFPFQLPVVVLLPN